MMNIYVTDSDEDAIVDFVKDQGMKTQIRKKRLSKSSRVKSLQRTVSASASSDYGISQGIDRYRQYGNQHPFGQHTPAIHRQHGQSIVPQPSSVYQQALDQFSQMKTKPHLSLG